MNHILIHRVERDSKRDRKTQALKRRQTYSEKQQQQKQKTTKQATASLASTAQQYVYD